jgi:hypothetical protein
MFLTFVCTYLSTYGHHQGIPLWCLWPENVGTNVEFDGVDILNYFLYSVLKHATTASLPIISCSVCSSLLSNGIKWSLYQVKYYCAVNRTVYFMRVTATERRGGRLTSLSPLNGSPACNIAAITLFCGLESVCI